MLQTFSTQLDTLPSHFPRVSLHPTSTKATVCDTKPTYSSTIRNPSFLCSNKFRFSHFSSVSPFHSNTSVNCMHFLVSIIFCLVLCCLFFFIKLEFHNFLHCNYNTSLFDFFIFGICFGVFGCPVCQPSKL